MRPRGSVPRAMSKKTMGWVGSRTSEVSGVEAEVDIVRMVVAW